METKDFFGNLLNRFAESDDDQVALSIYDGKCVIDITYHQLLADVLRAVGYLKRNNIIHQHIALLSANCYNWIVTYYAIVLSENMAVLMNPSLPLNILQWQLEKADVSIICTDDTMYFELCQFSKYNVYSLANEWKCSYDISANEIHSPMPNDTITLMFTSGTTGKSKVVAFSAENIQNSFLNLSETHARQGMERVFLALPFFHIAGLGCAFQVFQQLHTLCLGQGTKYIFDDMTKLNPTNISLVPSILDSIIKLYRLAKSPEEIHRFVGKNLQRISVGGASLKSNTVSFMMQKGIVIDTLYGMTETAGDGIRCQLDDKHIGTIGFLSGNMQCKIENGEIMLKSPSIMKEYYKDPEETAKVIEDGWIHTGDMGYCDEDGYYYITGRKKNVIILSNGENVNPEEIEATWGECEEILECLVYGDAKGICADVYAANQEKVADYIKKYNESMPMYRQVYKVNYSDKPLEKTASGKIKRKENAYA